MWQSHLKPSAFVGVRCKPRSDCYYLIWVHTVCSILTLVNETKRKNESLKGSRCCYLVLDYIIGNGWSMFSFLKGYTFENTVLPILDGWLRMGLLPPPREFCRHILSCRELKAESFKRCLHSVLRGVSL